MSNSFTQPNFTDLVRLTEAMIMFEPEPDKEALKKVHEIYEYTDSEVNFPLGKLEFVVFYQINVGQAGLNKEIEIDGKYWKLLDLYGFLDKTNQKLVEIVVAIAKKYSLEIPINASTTAKLSL